MKFRFWAIFALIVSFGAGLVIGQHIDCLPLIGCSELPPDDLFIDWFFGWDE